MIDVNLWVDASDAPQIDLRLRLRIALL